MKVISVVRMTDTCNFQLQEQDNNDRRALGEGPRRGHREWSCADHVEQVWSDPLNQDLCIPQYNPLDGTTVPSKGGQQRRDTAWMGMGLSASNHICSAVFSWTHFLDYLLWFGVTYF